MAKIHTHYDNLKVARLAPQEVIRAAYKALSQKYHPDKNPGDEKAARIMAILNSAYGTLSDPVRRKEHDEWIAAEEWEIEWLESTRSEEGRDKPRHDAPPAWDAVPVAVVPPYRAVRDPRWWFGLMLCFGLGCAAGAFFLGQERAVPVPVVLAAALGTAGTGASTAAGPAPDSRADGWAVAKPHVADAGQRPPDIRTLGVTELVVPARVADCESELHSLIAPNGEAWPAQSGYVDGFPIGNQGPETQISIDNSRNGSPVLVKIFDLDRRSNVRHVYVLARDSFVADRLAAGKYEVRYQNVDVGGSQAECVGRRKQAAAARPLDPG
ncbi:J domain-containing protein [Massilia sp. P8910]|uniref:J domain-containing protein n=1 Tax=Massilia antarctica TaxID=2765360 RepID=UPI0006BB7594|nr:MULTISPECIES: J domain-containing protein [Massilia]MCE3607829.1 J domain-containing protein [Massilia antarctica]MCY0911851.1 J domain-containing protein [Massilia sp. H27-R4]CUI06694.1 Chaperone protein DnaJ [Janthinobacterium sp. CG23_2]CUU30480.1 Chaperone protein DnaJ [Janthinobacterium sp. CG23_2]